MKPTAEACRETLVSISAILENDHFVYISGDHGSGWINMNALYPHTDKTITVTKLLGEIVRDLDVQVVCGPATGGLILAQWLANHMNVLTVFAEHDDVHPDSHMRGAFILRRRFDRIVKGQKVLIVDDVVNTGHSIRQTAEAVRAASGTVVGAASICSRGNCGAEQLGVPHYRFLTEIKIPSWKAADCRLCADGVKVNTDYAHGLEFVNRQARSKAATVL